MMFKEIYPVDVRAAIIKSLCAFGYRIAGDKGARLVLGIIGAAIIVLGLHLAKYAFFKK